VTVDWSALCAGAGVGLVVGMTGSGGGALLTPILILLLGVDAKSAVASDLVSTLFMRPVAGAVHLRHRTIQWPIVRRLVIGSVPAAFIAGLLSHVYFSSKHAIAVLSVLIGVALISSGAVTVVRRTIRHYRPGPATAQDAPGWVTILVGVVGGVIVGITSVGSGSLMLVALGVCYPGLAPSALVGTDLVQAVPLVGAAALGHLAGGGFHLSLTTWIVVGGVPAAFVGGHLAGRVSDRILGVIIGTIIFGSGCALIGWVPGSIVGVVAAVAVGVLILRLRRGAAEVGAASPAPIPATESPIAPGR
jgi:hypothetical protein